MKAWDWWCQVFLEVVAEVQRKHLLKRKHALWNIGVLRRPGDHE